MSPSTEQHRLTILGASTVGTGVAELALAHGVPVVLVALGPEPPDRAAELIAARLGRVRSELPLTATGAIERGAGATVVVEAVTEKAVVKTRALAMACAVVDPGTPLVSCSSGIPVDELADWAGRPEDVVGVHFTVPVPALRKVEVLPGRRTSDETVQTVLDLLAVLGREPVRLRDAGAPVTARLLYPMINSAARIAGERVATVAEIDALMSSCSGDRQGPLRAADRIGIDSLVNSLEALYSRTGDHCFQPCDILLEKVRAGELGVKSGRGFYTYG